MALIAKRAGSIGNDAELTLNLDYPLVVKPKVTRPVSMSELLMQPSPKIGYGIAPQMHVVSALQGSMGSFVIVLL